MLHASASKHRPCVALSTKMRLPSCHTQFLLRPRGARAVVRYRPDEAPAKDAAASSLVDKARSATEELEHKLGAQGQLLGDKRHQVEEMLATLRTLADEAASLQNKLLTTLTTTGTTSELPSKDNVASARAWIEAWRAKGQPDGQVDATQTANQHSQPVPENVASARAWIAAWRAAQQPGSTAAASSTAHQVPENVVSARAWIAAWRAQQPAARPATIPPPRLASAAVVAHAVPAKPANGTAPAPKPAQAAANYTNTNRFWVPRHVVDRFLRTIAARQADMELAEGFVGFVVRPPAGSTQGVEGVYEVSSTWLSIPAWEAWSLGRGHVRNQLPTGVFQYVPGKGQGFPEDFVPFKDLSDIVPNAKY